VSGTGRVAEGVIWSDGTVDVHGLGAHPSWAWIPPGACPRRGCSLGRWSTTTDVDRATDLITASLACADQTPTASRKSRQDAGIDE
jgi:hypothetical protein